MAFNLTKFSKNNLILGCLGLVLFAVHFLPDNVREMLIFNHQSPSIIGAFATHFVHASNQHLLSNVFIGFTALFLIQWCFHKVGRENVFQKMVGSYLLILPLIVTGLSFLVFNLARVDLQDSMGFSALALAFVGAIPPVVFYFVKNSQMEEISVADSVPFFNIGVVFILISYIFIWFNSSAINFSMGMIASLSLSAVALLGYSEYRLMNILNNKLGLSLREFAGLFSRKEKSILGLSLFVFVFGALSVAPSSGVVSDDGFVNIISHMIGFTLGFFAAELCLVDELLLIQRKD